MPRVGAAGRDRRHGGAGRGVAFEGLASDDVPFAVADDVVTTAVDGRAHADRKHAAMRAHPTQMTVDGPFFALSNNLGQEVLGTEFYRLVRGDPRPGRTGGAGLGGRPVRRPARMRALRLVGWAALAVLVAAWLALVEVFWLPWRLGGVPVPVSLPAAVAGNLLLVGAARRLSGLAAGRRAARRRLAGDRTRRDDAASRG